MPNDHGAPVTNKQAIERLKAKHDGDIPLGAILTLRNPFQVYDLIEYDWSAIRFGRKVRKKRWYVWSSGCVVCKADFTCRAQRNFFTLKRTCPEHTGQLPRAVKPKPEKIAKPPKPEKPKRKYPNADAIRQTVDEYCLVHDTMWIHAFVFFANAVGRDMGAGTGSGGRLCNNFAWRGRMPRMPSRHRCPVTGFRCVIRTIGMDE